MIQLEAAPQYAILMQVLEPLGIIDICLTTGNILDMSRIDQEDLSTARLKNLKDRHPVNAG